MATDPNDWPALGEELARKSLDYLERQMHAHGEGELSKEKLLVVADTLSDITQGLISWESWDAIYAVRQALLGKPMKEMRR